MAIVSAIYFKGNWQHPFKTLMTYPGDFHLTKESVVPVQMMNQKFEFQHAENNEAWMVDLPFDVS
jgi:serpin B